MPVFDLAGLWTSGHFKQTLQKHAEQRAGVDLTTSC